MNQHRVYEPHIFLCHASEDKPLVQELYHQLKGARYHPWLDKEDLLPGQDWWREIERIIRNPYNLIAVCLSSKSITKRGGASVNYEWSLRCAFRACIVPNYHDRNQGFRACIAPRQD